MFFRRSTLTMKTEAYLHTFHMESSQLKDISGKGRGFSLCQNRWNLRDLVSSKITLLGKTNSVQNLEINSCEIIKSSTLGQQFTAVSGQAEQCNSGAEVFHVNLFHQRSEALIFDVPDCHS